MIVMARFSVEDDRPSHLLSVASRAGKRIACPVFGSSRNSRSRRVRQWS
jgi:hypothetical protein